MKKIAIMLAIEAIVLLSVSFTIAEIIEPDGFKELKWEMTIEQAREKGVLVGEGSKGKEFILFVGKGETVGNVGVGVGYIFYENKLGSVLLDFHKNDFNTIKRALTDKYGEPSKIEEMKNVYGNPIGVTYKWDKPNTVITLKFNQAKGDCKLVYQYKPLVMKGVEKSLKESEKAKDDL